MQTKDYTASDDLFRSDYSYFSSTSVSWLAHAAEYTNKITKTGGFLDSVFDKIAEVAIFFGILVGGYAEPYLVFLAITLSLLVSYTRSRAESLGVKLQGIGIGERAERLLVIAIVGIIGFMEYAVIIVIIIAAITFIQRIVVTARALRE